MLNVEMLFFNTYGTEGNYFFITVCDNSPVAMLVIQPGTVIPTAAKRLLTVNQAIYMTSVVMTLLML